MRSPSIASSLLTIWLSMTSNLTRCRSKICIMLVLLVGFCPVARPQDLNAPSLSGAGTRVSQEAEDRTLLAVSRRIRRAHLTSRPDSCLAFRFDSTTSKRDYLVDVRENHLHPECEGDPQTQPHLFTVKVNRRTGRMYVDSRAAGVFYPLPDGR